MNLHKIAKSIKVAYTLGAASIFLAGTAFAQAAGPLKKVSDGPSKEVAPFPDLGVLVGNVFAFVLVIASILLFLYLILGGVQWLTSGGDKAATQAARDRITAALTGLLIILAVWGIFRILEAAFGISVLSGINLPVTSQNPDAYDPAPND